VPSCIDQRKEFRNDCASINAKVRKDEKGTAYEPCCGDDYGGVGGPHWEHGTQAEAPFPDRIVFASNRVAGKGVDNPTGDREIFRMNPNGTGVRQLTFNGEHDGETVLSPDGTKSASMSRGDQTSNPKGDWEIYVVNAADGSGNRNLTNNVAEYDESPEWGR
jgi:hypothetical protein